MGNTWMAAAARAAGVLAGTIGFVACGAAVEAGGAGGSGGAAVTSSHATSSGTITGSSGVGGSTGSTMSVTCFDAKNHLVAEAKACTTAADCTMLATATCCGPSVIVGLASSQKSVYGPCYVTPTNCPPLGCASQATAEDGTPAGGGPVQVQCVAQANGERACMTSVVSIDAGAGDSGTGDGGIIQCTGDAQCAAGLKCCYPCGVAGCTNQCVTPMANGLCPMYQ